MIYSPSELCDLLNCPFSSWVHWRKNRELPAERKSFKGQISYYTEADRKKIEKILARLKGKDRYKRNRKKLNPISQEFYS